MLFYRKQFDINDILLEVNSNNIFHKVIPIEDKPESDKIFHHLSILINKDIQVKQIMFNRQAIHS